MVHKPLAAISWCPGGIDGVTVHLLGGSSQVPFTLVVNTTMVSFRPLRIRVSL